MSSAHARRWLHPQTVPRGFLRLYILNALSRGPESGYSIIQKIDERTEGAWRPGPGTMYPLLKSLAREGLVKPAKDSIEGGGKAYALTPRGRRTLDEMRRTIAGMGRKEGVMGRLFSDLLPGELFVRFILKRFVEGNSTLREKLAELPDDERAAVLLELKDLLDAQSRWVRSELEGLRGSNAKGKPQVRA